MLHVSTILIISNSIPKLFNYGHTDTVTWLKISGDQSFTATEKNDFATPENTKILTQDNFNPYFWVDHK